ncbi:MAG: PD40 domain-containing protein [Planctomycetaceae bacterium]|nr:PD40 domain-containing protein [Planctomycetaceae bacterium]
MTTVRSSVPLLAVLCAFGFGNATADDLSENVVLNTFRGLDSDGDGRLTADELLHRSGNPDRHLRDLKLFDVDGDDALSAVEFSAVPGVVEYHTRGALPDPFDELLDAAMAAMDESYGEWDQHPEIRVPVGVFVVSLVDSLGEGLSIRLQEVGRQADPDGDGQVTRGEARDYLKRHLGITSPDGERLRQENGRVLNWRKWSWLDADGNQQITKGEYLARNNTAWGEKTFTEGDRDSDGQVDWDEYSNPIWRHGHEDVVVTFCNADTNFDGLMDAEELATATPAWRQRALPMILPAFDDDGDGKLSLPEYRVCPFGNFLCSWEQVKRDTDRDRRLSFAEYAYDKQNFLLLQRLYFHRFDRDGDGWLTQEEFAFELQPSHALYRLSVDGSKFERFWSNEKLPDGGSPEMSPDGKWVLFDDYPRGTIVRVEVETGLAEDLCKGLMPSWSADGRHFAISSGGVSIVDANGGNRRSFANGWGAQWSPDGKSIAYTLNGGLWAYDVESGQSREVLGKAQHPYSSLYYGMGWSPDGSRIALKVTGGGKSDIISVSMRGDDPDLQVHFSTTSELNHTMSWSPDGKRLVFSLREPARNRLLLHQIDLEDGGPPTIVPGIDESLTYLDAQFTPDGKWLIMFAR